MNLYRQSIAIFGFVIPLVICIAIIGAAMLAKGQVSDSFNRKFGQYEGYEKQKLSALALEAEINKKRQHIEAWEAIVSQQTASAVSSTLKEIEDQLPSKEFRRTLKEHPAGRAGFASVSAQNSTQVKLAFRATFRTMQRALLELETRMPQLQLQELRIDPSPRSNSLNVQVSYTAWEK